MKKQIFKASLSILFALLLFTSCNSGGTHKFSDADTMKIAAWNKLFGAGSASVDSLTGSNKGIYRAADKPVPPALADYCVAQYQSTYDPKYFDANIAIIKKAYTYSMNFGSKNLSAWALDIATNTNATQIQMRLGIYKGDILTTYPTDLAGKEGRLTIFLYPVLADGSLAVYNTGATNTGQAQPFNFVGLQP